MPPLEVVVETDNFEDYMNNVQIIPAVERIPAVNTDAPAVNDSAVGFVIDFYKTTFQTSFYFIPY